jgi:ribosomal protein S18 acetylase RimI-like enzyme
MAGSDFIVREARLGDVKAIARIYVDSWRDTYPGILPAHALLGMDVERHAARWRSAVAMPGRESVLVAESRTENIVGMTSLGRARDTDLGFEGEVYTLYVDPMATGKGIGRALLRAGFEELAERGFKSCLIWAHAQNPARFFYQAMGGKPVAERITSMMGTSVPEVAFGWKTLALVKASRTH